MMICKEDVNQYKTLMAGDVDTYCVKLLAYFEANQTPESRKSKDLRNLAKPK